MFVDKCHLSLSWLSMLARQTANIWLSIIKVCPFVRSVKLKVILATVSKASAVMLLIQSLMIFRSLWECAFTFTSSRLSK